MTWAFLILAIAELAIVHLLVSLWNVTVALILTAISLAATVWIIALIRSFRRLPVSIANGRLIMRAGVLIRVETAAANVRGLRRQWASGDLKKSGVLNMALLAYPNIIVDFDAPVARGKRAVSAVAHRLDDPVAFARAVSAEHACDG